MSVRFCILIPTMPRRQEFLSRLRAVLEPQLTPEVAVLEETDRTPEEAKRTTGSKRNILVSRAFDVMNGEGYVAHVDDDDTVAPWYCVKILEAIESGADVIGIKGTMIVDGNKHTARTFINSTRYAIWERVGPVYGRPANHLNPIRVSIAKKAPFPDVTFGEDRAYSELVRQFIRTEHMIEDMGAYTYQYRRRKDC